MASSAALAAAAPQAVSTISASDIGGFAGQRLRANKDQYLKAFSIDTFVGLVEEKKYRDWWWIGEQPGKWLHASLLAASTFGDDELKRRAEGILARMIAAQEPGGYLGITDPGLRMPRHPVRGMDPYELYFTLHALLAAHETWGREDALGAARKLGDFFVDKIGPGKAEFWPLPKPVTIAGHEVHYGLEGALLVDPMMRLFAATRESRYLEWCQWVVSNIDKWSVTGAFSNLDKVAAGTMKLNEIQPNVHTHTLQMNLLGSLRLYGETGDRRLLEKALGVFRVASRDYTYITGAVSVAEVFAEPGRLPNTGSVAETCASMSWIWLNHALLNWTGDGAHADAIERLLWNHLFAAQAWDGDGFRYHCPLNGWKPLQAYTGPDCCSASGPLMLAHVPGLIYGRGDDGPLVHQYIPSRTTVECKGIKVGLRQVHDYPSTEAISIEVAPDRAAQFGLRLRIPAWCDNFAIKVNGQRLSAPLERGYAKIDRTWAPADRLVLQLPMNPHWVSGAGGNEGLSALVRGPVVYALDGAFLAEPDGEALAGDRRSDDLPGLASVVRALRPALAPEGGLGPAFEVTARLRAGGSRDVRMVPFANLGKWYRNDAERARGPKPQALESTIRPKPGPAERIIPYAVWLRAVSG